MVITRVLFENVVAVATKKGLYVPLRFQNLIHVEGKSQRFKRKSLTILETFIKNHRQGVTPPGLMELKPFFVI